MKREQDMSHPHAVVYDPAGNFIAGADLGTDEVLIFQLDVETGALSVVNRASTAWWPARDTSPSTRTEHCSTW